MIPSIFRAQKLSEAKGQGETGRALALKAAGLEAAAALGFIGAVGACSGYLIPRGFGASIAATGGPYLALEIFLLFYITCIALTWWYYLRKCERSMSINRFEIAGRRTSNRFVERRDRPRGSGRTAVARASSSLRQRFRDEKAREREQYAENFAPMTQDQEERQNREERERSAKMSLPPGFCRFSRRGPIRRRRGVGSQSNRERGSNRVGARG
jgi:hypothetical protein